MSTYIKTESKVFSLYVYWSKNFDFLNLFLMILSMLLHSFIFRMPLLPHTFLQNLGSLHLEVHLELLDPSKLCFDYEDEYCDQNYPDQSHDIRENQQQQSKIWKSINSIKLTDLINFSWPEEQPRAEEETQRLELRQPPGQLMLGRQHGPAELRGRTVKLVQRSLLANEMREDVM